MQISNELRVGIMFLTGLILLVLVLVTLTRWGETRRTYAFTIRFKQAQGLKEGAAVQVSGVEVGRVSAITLDPKTNEPLVTVMIDRRVQLYRGYTYSIGVGGIVGERFVDIARVPERIQGSPLEAGGEVTGSLRPDMNDLIDNANGLVTQLTLATDSLNLILGDGQNQANLRQSLVNLNTATLSAARFSHQLDRTMARNQAVIDSSLADFQRTSASSAAFASALNVMLTRNERAVDETIANMRSSSASAAEFTAALNDIMLRNQQAIDLIMANAGKTSASAAEFTAALNVTLQRNQQAIKLIVTNMESISTDLREVSNSLNTKLGKSKILENLETATQRAVQITDRLDTIATAVSTLVADEELTKGMRESVSNLRRASEDLQSLMADARDAAAPFPEVTANLREVTDDMRNITQPVREITPETTQNILQISRNLRTTSDSVSSATQQILRFGKVLRETSFETQAQLIALAEGEQSTRADLNVDIKGPQTMMRVGIADVGTRDRVNLQFGNRLGKGWFRYGLVQSSFGVGGELAPSPNWRVSGELFAPGDIRANAHINYRWRPLGKDWWLTAGWYDLFHNSSAFGVGMQYRPE